MIIDSNETPGGLASTDTTPEGFVSYSTSQWQMWQIPFSDFIIYSSTMLADTLFSHITNTLTTALTRLCQRKMTGTHTSVSLMSAARTSGFLTHSKTTFPFCQRRSKSSVSMAWLMLHWQLVLPPPSQRISMSGSLETWARESQTYS